MSHTSGNILLHFIFSTEGRRPLIKSAFRDDLFAYLGGIIREMNATAVIINGDVDHVHMLIRVRPAHAAGGNCARRKDEFVVMAARKASAGFCVANRLWSFQPE